LRPRDDPAANSRLSALRCHLPDLTITPTDEELVHATLAGSQASFALLVHRYRRAALARAVAIVGDPAEAEDVAQESFIHGYAELANCRQPARFGAWLLISVQRRALNRVRSIRRQRAVALHDSIPAGADGATELDRRELRDRLRQALVQLSAVQREVVLLADLEQWSHAEIAAGLGISVLMSRRHLSDARRKLRALLGAT
jgi:RNA polymerase sigma-70 factor (ECF subfamily)